MGRAGRPQGNNAVPADVTSATPSSINTTTVFQSDDTGPLVEELLPLADGTSLELGPDDPALLLRGLAEIEGIQFQRGGGFEVQFRDGTRAMLLLDEGRIAFSSGQDDPSLVLGAFARALALRASQSNDPMDLSLDPATKRLFARLAELHRDISEHPHDHELMREFAQVSRQLMENGLLHDPSNLTTVAAPSRVLPGQLEVNGHALSRRMAGEEDDPALLPNSVRREREYASRVNEAMARVREGGGPLADNPVAAYFSAATGQPLEDVQSALTPEQVQERVRAALIVSGQVDPHSKCSGCGGSGDGEESLCSACYGTGLQATGKYEHLTPFLNGKNPSQTHGIPVSMTAASQGGLELTPSQAKALNIMRGSHRSGRRFFLLRGPASSGKDTVAKEFCSGNVITKVPVNLGGTASSGLERALGTEALQSAKVHRVKMETDPETGEERVKMIPAFEKEADGKLKVDDAGNHIPIMGEDGKQKQEPEYEEDGFSISGTNLGEIGRSAHLPVAFVISDPDGQEKEFSRLHAALGDDVAKPNGRFVMVDSSSGEVLPLHPSTTFIVTTNERTTLKNPDGRFPEATSSRATGIDVDAPDEGEEAKRIAKMVSSQLSLDTASDIEHKNVSPELAELDIAPEDVMPFVRAQRKLVAYASQGNGAIAQEVVARDTADGVAGFMENLLDDGLGTSIDPVDAFVGRLHKIVRLKGTTPESRDAIIREIIADEVGAMQGQVAPLKKRIRAIRQGEEDPERVKRNEAAEEASRQEQKEAEEAAAEKEEV